MKLSKTFRYFEERLNKGDRMQAPTGSYHWGKWANEVEKLEAVAQAADFVRQEVSPMNSDAAEALADMRHALDALPTWVLEE